MSNSTTSSQPYSEYIFKIILWASAFLSLSILLFVIGFLFYESLDFFNLKYMPKLLSPAGWYPTENHFNIWPMLLSSLAISFGALIVSLPLCILSALFIEYFCPNKLSLVLKRFVEVFAGIPSVIFGLWGLTAIVPFVHSYKAPGTSLISAIIVLALMVAPTILLLILGKFKYVPKELKDNALSLGLSRQSFISRVVLPWSGKSIFISAILGFGRAIGETMAVLMVAGNVVQYPSGLFVPVRTMTANIALEMSYAMEFHRASLFFCGLVLSLLVTLLMFTFKEQRFN